MSFDSSTIESINHGTLIVSDGQGGTLLNVTLLRETTPVTTLPPEPEQDIKIKLGWVFGEEGNLKVLRLKRDYNNGGNIYSLTEGVIEVSSSSPFYRAFGSSRYNIAETLQQYVGSQGKVMVVLDGGESQFVAP